MKSSEKLRTTPQTPRKRATRVKICNAARELFFEQGFDGTTVEQIAKAAGTRRSTLYTHFADKNEILSALIEDYLAAVQRLIDRLPAPKPTRAEIDDWVRSFADLAAGEQVPTVLLMHSGSSTHAPAAVREFGQAMLESLSRRLPAFETAMTSDMGLIRAQSVLRELGWSLAHYAEDPRHGDEYLTVAAEWFDYFVRQGGVGPSL